jgi:gluconate 5-dehydrogenase
MFLENLFMKANKLFDISGKIALITGSTGGIGYALAKGLCEGGATAILNARDEERLQQQVQEFRDAGYSAFGYCFDITNSDQISEAVEKVKRHVGTIDVLVNNAGVTIRSPLENFKDSDWDTIININLTGAYKVSKAVVKGMISKAAGKIINIGSLQCELGRPSITPYAASKGGLKMLTKGMAVEWAKYNIQSNGIGPGYFKTNMTKALYENKEFDDWVCSRTPSRRWGLTDELCGALIFFASSASDYINGQMIYVDGGLTASV